MHRVATHPQVCVKLHLELEPFTPFDPVKNLVRVVGVGAKHHLAQPVLDAAAQHQAVQVGMGRDAQGQLDGLAHKRHSQWLALHIGEPDRLNGCLQGARHRLDLPLRRLRLDQLLTLVRGQHGVVVVHHGFWRALHGHTAMLKQNRPIADGLNGLLVVTHNQQRRALPLESPNPLKALVLKIGVTHRQRLIHNQDIWAARRCHAECQAHLHAAAVHPDRLVHVVANLSKSFYRRHQHRDVVQVIAQQLARHHHILPSGEVLVKTNTKLQQGGHPTRDTDAARRRLCGTGDHLQQRALARAVQTDHSHRLARPHGKADVLQHPFLLVPALSSRAQPFQQARPACRVLLEGLAHVADNNRPHQSSSTMSPECLRNSCMPTTHNSSANTPGYTRLPQSGQSPFIRLT